MSDKDILIFMAVIVGAAFIIVGTGWIYFVRWFKSEQSSGRRHIDAHTAEVLRERKRQRELQKEESEPSSD